ncbi:MAG: hypothetical protein ACLTPN_00215 [Clostridia bacterium]
MKKVLKYIIIFIIIIAIIILGINLYVILSTKKQIIKEEKYTELSDIDCIIVTQKYHLYRALYITNQLVKQSL